MVRTHKLSVINYKEINLCVGVYYQRRYMDIFDITQHMYSCAVVLLL